MNNEPILTVELVVEVLKTSYTLREAAKKIYIEWSRKFDKRLHDFIKKNNINKNDYLLVREKKHYYCKHCGKEITGRDASQKKFCNSSCAAKYNNKGRVHSLESRIKVSNSLLRHFNGDINLIEDEQKKDYLLKQEELRKNFDPNKDYYCLNCGKKIEKVYLTKENKYCNKKCQDEYTHKQYIEKWKNGEVTGLSGKYDLSSHIRRYMLEKANYQCKCGWHEVNKYTGKTPLQIHHIDGNCLNNKEDNLEVLCPNCHSLTENFGSRNKNCADGRTQYYTSQYREMRNKHKDMQIKISDGTIKVQKVVICDNQTNEITALYRRNYQFEFNQLAQAEVFDIDSDNEIEWKGLSSLPDHVTVFKLTEKGLVYAFDIDDDNKDNFSFKHYYGHFGIGKDYHPEKERYMKLNCIIPEGTKYIEYQFGILSEYLIPISLEEIPEYEGKHKHTGT